MPPEEAIKTVTLNPAKSLGLDARMGSLEPGKEGTFTVWNGSPLSPYSACEQTWILGRRYFDRDSDLAGREALARERAALLAHARAAKHGAAAAAGGHRPAPRYLEDADESGNECADHTGHSAPFTSETARQERLEDGEVQR